MDYIELIDELDNYVNQYENGNGREIVGTVELLNMVAGAIESLMSKTNDSRLEPKMVNSKGWNGNSGTRYVCPNCKKTIREGSRYCDRCGQSLLFPSIEKNEKGELYLNFDKPRGSNERT